MVSNAWEGSMLLYLFIISLLVNTIPHFVELVDKRPVAKDIPYPDTIELFVDATNIEQGIFKVKEIIPLGPNVNLENFTLMMPKWLPGKHAPRGEIEKLVNLNIIDAKTKKNIPWYRDEVDMYTFHLNFENINIDVKKIKQIQVEFYFVSSKNEKNYGRIVTSEKMINLQWEGVSLYPGGYYTRNIPISATVKYPKKFRAASGLPAKSTKFATDHSTYVYETTNYETLIDSPTLAGEYYNIIELTPRVNLNLFGDDPKYIQPTPEQIQLHKNMVNEAISLFGSQQYDKYEFLALVTNKLGGVGLEHHRSSENQLNIEYFTDWKKNPGKKDLLSHEMVHSWNGKHRRPKLMWTPDYSTPVRNQLLWVYEGQTQFWGAIIATRAGLHSKTHFLEELAETVGKFLLSNGRVWRPLVDTTYGPILTARRPLAWKTLQLGENYYSEGSLIWLEINAILHVQTNGKYSMNDFAKTFFGHTDGDWGTLGYDLDDIIAVLNTLAPYDWKNYFEKRINHPNQDTPIESLKKSGYDLVFTDKMPAWYESNGVADTNFIYSIGAMIEKDGDLSEIVWGSPIFEAELKNGDKILAVNGLLYSPEVLKDALKAKRKSITLAIKNQDKVFEKVIHYQNGIRYPTLSRIIPDASVSALDKLLEPIALK